ncbi:MAG TPA: membrane protein insertase YidC [Desulfomonilaceae bacterium]|nr:membrane protein insertase YidC [Desulfomonilaceae bacterium]
MDRNLILAIILSVVIIVGFQYFFQAFSPPPPPRKPLETQETVKERHPAPEAVKPAEVKPPVKPGMQERAPAPTTARPVEETTAAETPEIQIKVDSPIYEAILSSKGGRIISFKLKDYTVSLTGPELVDLFDPNGPDTAGPSIVFTRRDETFNDMTVGYSYESNDTAIRLAGKGAKKSITFRATRPDGLSITKTFTFRVDSYEVGFGFTLVNNSNEDRNYLVTFPWRKIYKGEGGDRFSWNSAEILVNGMLKDYYFKDIKGDEEPSGQIKWAGLGDVYFFKALVFGKNPANSVRLFKPSPEGFAEIWIRYGALDLPQGQPVETNLMVYLGPKEHSALSAAGHDLSMALFYSNYHILDVMAEYLLKFLRFCNRGFELFGIRIPGTHNYGIDIIILTVIIKILFIPLTHKSMKSMKRMQDLQPQIAKLREKFKDDKVAINKATMELFREQKVNPLGSCWPMFLQLPVFIALYQALSYAIELRHAPFVCIPRIFFCINDLSGPDPYYVTPILMGATMVIQQWMTPSGGDPMQKKMMMVMPVVLTYVFLNMPSGLVLYWLISNVLSIGQQAITNRMAK